MARGINKVILIGNVGRVEMHTTQGDAQVANVSLATSEQWRDKQTGQNQERTEWHRVVLFGRLAEITGQFVKKGMRLYIEGRLQTRKWQGQDGQDRFTTEIVANDMQMLGGGEREGSSGGGGSTHSAPSGGYGPGQGSASGAYPGGNSTSAAAGSGGGGGRGRFDDFDDDIPFAPLPAYP